MATDERIGSLDSKALSIQNPAWCAFYVGEPDVGVASPIGETRIRKIQNPKSKMVLVGLFYLGEPIAGVELSEIL
jgi:hypothetical protein